MLLQQNIAQSFQSPIVRILLATIALGLLYILWREVRKIPAKLFALMATAFVDMVGLLMIIPLLPFYVKSLGGSGIDVLGVHLGVGLIIGLYRLGVYRSSITKRARLGKIFRSRRPPARSTNRVRRFGNCLSHLRFCALTPRSFSVAHRAGRRGRHSGCDPGLRC